MSCLQRAVLRKVVEIGVGGLFGLMSFFGVCCMGPGSLSPFNAFCILFSHDIYTKDDIPSLDRWLLPTEIMQQTSSLVSVSLLHPERQTFCIGALQGFCDLFNLGL